MTKRAITYARVSGDDRKKEGRNLAGQLTMYREYCAEKDYRIVAELAEDDRGASGADWNLPRLNEALDMARAGEFDVLVTRELDRFARGLAKQLVIEGEFKRHGVEVEYVLADYEDSPEGQLNKHIRAVIAEYERVKIAERMIRGRRQVVRAGKVMLHGDKPPFGYRVEDGMLVIHEPEAETVRLAFQWYVYESLSAKAIARRLAGTPTWTDIHGGHKVRGYGEWGARQVLNLLACETYAGIWHYGKKNFRTGQVNPREHWLTLDVPAIISQELWDKAQQQRKANTIQSKRNVKNEYLVGRRIRCGMCRSGVCGYSPVVRGKVYQYYRCSATSARGLAGATCSIPSFRVDQVDDAVWSWLRDLLTEPERLRQRLEEEREKRGKTARPLQERLVVVDDFLAQKRAAHERCFQAYISGKWDEEVALREKAQLEELIADLEKERADLVATLETRVITDEQIQEIEELAAFLDIAASDWVFEKRRKLIDDLDVRTTLTVEDGQKVVYVRCKIGEGVLRVEGATFHSGAFASQR